MRIGIMLRAYGEKGGIGVYTRNVVAELLALDTPHEFLLFYRDPQHLGRFADRPDVQERLVQAPNKALWDQVAIPRVARREALDVLFHPKFTAPLFAPCPVVMTVHGADWFIPDQAQYYPWLDVRYVRTLMPLYFRKCARVISVSQLTTENFNHVLNLPPCKVQTIYFAPARHFRPVTDPATLDCVRAKYNLPERFILTLTKRDGDRRKNLGQLFRAYARYHQAVDRPASLVVGGQNCHHLRADYALPESGYGADITFPGWIEQADLPAVYSLAALYLYPSNLEAFPIPLTEAMACGTPIVTSAVNGLQEIAGDAALLVDPRDPAAIAAAIQRVLADQTLQTTLSARGRERARLFSWDRCAHETLAVLESAATGGCN